MISSIFQIVGSVFGVIAAMWISHIINKYLQAYQNHKNALENAKDKKDMEDELKRRNDEHKKLKDIEGR
jgi:mannitol-specific phosphotransferase system IIBC component